jgi:hypothetical protein
MVEGEYYFTIHAPRQSGKTTFLDALTEKINSDGKYYALNCSLLALSDIVNEDLAINTIISKLNFFMQSSQALSISNNAFLYDNLPGINDSRIKLSIFLNKLCEKLDKDLVVFFDEVDCLSGPGLISFLSQIRDSYQIRFTPGNKFPRSLALVGLMDIKDIQVADAEPNGAPPCPFNIKLDSLTLPNYTREQIGILYGQHTEAAGQTFEDRAIEKAWLWSAGQPWLVNALAKIAVENLLKNDFSKSVTVEIIDLAAKAIIAGEFDHSDFLIKRLAEPNVRRTMEAVIVGAPYFDETTISDDDIQYVLNLGLLKLENGIYKPASPIYGEIIFRKLAKGPERRIPNYEDQWIKGRKLDMRSLLRAFQKFWRENEETPGEPDRVAEIDPFLACFAFIQKTLNGHLDGINIKYALGQSQVDLFLHCKMVTYPVSLRSQRPGQKYADVAWEKSMEQLQANMDKSRSNIGWLVVFELDKTKSLKEKKYWLTMQYKNSTIHVVGC